MDDSDVIVVIGANPLRGQNNVQGACDMGSFPNEFSGYRHVSDDAVRATFEALWGRPLNREPGLRIPNMLDAAVYFTFKAIYIQGEDILQSDPDIKHVSAGLAAMECVVVHDLFLNETANYAPVFLPGSTFLETTGTLTNAERRIQLVRKVMTPKNGGHEDWQVTQLIANAVGLDSHYTHASQIMDEIAALTPTFAGVSFAKIEALGSVQWPCNDAHPCRGLALDEQRRSRSGHRPCRPRRRLPRPAACTRPRSSTPPAPLPAPRKMSAGTTPSTR